MLAMEAGNTTEDQPAAAVGVTEETAEETKQKQNINMKNLLEHLHRYNEKNQKMDKQKK